MKSLQLSRKMSVIVPARAKIEMWARRGPSRPRTCSLGAKSNSTLSAGCATIVCRIRSRQAALSNTMLMYTAPRGLPDIQVSVQHRKHGTTKMVAVLRNKRVTWLWLGCGINIRPNILARTAHGILGAVMRDVACRFVRKLFVRSAVARADTSGTRSCTPAASRPRYRQALFGARLPEQTLAAEREDASQSNRMYSAKL